MKTVAVLGGGPAGAFAAERLARAGLQDAWSSTRSWLGKSPAAAGSPTRLTQYPFLIDNDTPKKLVTETYLAAPKAGAVNMRFTNPLVIYSRIDLNRMLLSAPNEPARRSRKRACPA